MVKILREMVTGVMAYIIVTNVIDNVILGTSFSETIITSLAPIALAFGVVLAAMGVSFSGDKQGY